LKYFEIVRF